jgi:hypothetical protein
MVAHIFSQIINQISINAIDGQMIIGGMVIVIAGWCARGVWNTISGKH